MKPLYFKHGRARVKLIQLERDLYAVSDLWSEDRGKGHATAVMQRAVDFADMERLILRLIAQPYGHPIQTALNKRQLEAFYIKFGFERDPDDKHPFLAMIRYPREKNTSPNEKERNPLQPL